MYISHPVYKFCIIISIYMFQKACEFKPIRVDVVETKKGAKEINFNSVKYVNSRGSILNK